MSSYSGVAEEVNLDKLLCEMMGAVKAMMTDSRASGVQENRPLRVMLRRYARKYEASGMASSSVADSGSDTEGGSPQMNREYAEAGLTSTRRRRSYSPSQPGRFERGSYRRRSTINFSEVAKTHQLSAASAQAIFRDRSGSTASSFSGSAGGGGRHTAARRRSGSPTMGGTPKTTSSDTESGVDEQLQEEEHYRLVDPGLQRIALVGGDAGMYFEQLQLLRYCFLSPSAGRYELRPGEAVLRGVKRALFLDYFAPLLTRTNERGPNDSIAAMLDVDSTGVIAWSSLVKVLVNRGKLSDASREPYAIGAPSTSHHKSMISCVCIPAVGTAKGRSTSAWKFQGQDGAASSARGTDEAEDNQDPDARPAKKPLYGSAWTRLPSSLNTVFYTGGLDGIVREWTHNLAPSGGFYPGADAALCNTIVHHRSCHSYYSGADASVSLRNSPYSINDMTYLQSSKLLVAQSFGHVYNYTVKNTEDLVGRRVLHSVLRTENFHQRPIRTDSWVTVDAAEEERERRFRESAGDPTSPEYVASLLASSDIAAGKGGGSARSAGRVGGGGGSRPTTPRSSARSSSSHSRPGSSAIRGTNTKDSDTRYRRVVVSERQPKAPPEEASASFCVVPGENPLPAPVLTMQQAHGDVTALCGILHLRGYSDSTLNDSFVCGTNEGEVLLYSLAKGTEARTELEPSWSWNMLQGGLVFSINEVPTSDALLVTGLDVKGANFIDVVDIEKNAAKLRFLGGALCGTSLRSAGGATGSVIEKLLDTRLPPAWKNSRERKRVVGDHAVLNVDEFGTSFTRAEYDADRGLLIASGLSKTCALYSDSLPEPIHKLEDHADRVVGCSFNLARYRMLVMTADKTLHVYDSRMNRKIQSEIDFTLRSPVDGFSTAAFDKNAQLTVGCASTPVLFTPSIRADAHAVASGASGAIGSAVAGGIHGDKKRPATMQQSNSNMSPERRRAQILRQLKSKAATTGSGVGAGGFFGDDGENTDEAQTKLMAAASCTPGNYIAVCMGNVAGAISVRGIERDDGDKRNKKQDQIPFASISLESVSRSLVSVAKEPAMLFSAHSITDRCSHIAIEVPTGRRVAICVNSETVYLVNTLTASALYTVTVGAGAAKQQQAHQVSSSQQKQQQQQQRNSNKDEEVSVVVLTEAFVNTMALSGTAGGMSAAAAAANPQASIKRSILCVGGSHGQLVVALCDPPVALNVDGTPQTPEDEYDPHLQISGTGPPPVGQRSVVVNRRVFRPMHPPPPGAVDETVLDVTKGMRSAPIVSIVGGMSQAHASSLLVSTAAGDVYLVNFAQQQLGSSATLRRIMCYDSIIATFPLGRRDNYHISFGGSSSHHPLQNSSSPSSSSSPTRGGASTSFSSSGPLATLRGDIADGDLLPQQSTSADGTTSMTETFTIGKHKSAANDSNNSTLRRFQDKAAAKAHGRRKEEDLLDELSGGKGTMRSGGGQQQQQHSSTANGGEPRQSDEALAAKTSAVMSLWIQSTILASRQVEQVIVLAPHNYIAVLFGDGTVTICFLSQQRVLPQVAFRATRKGVFATSMIYYGAENMLGVGDAAGNITFFDLSTFWASSKEALEGASSGASSMAQSLTSAAELKRIAEEEEQKKKQEEERRKKEAEEEEVKRKKEQEEMRKSMTLSFTRATTSTSTGGAAGGGRGGGGKFGSSSSNSPPAANKSSMLGGSRLSSRNSTNQPTTDGGGDGNNNKKEDQLQTEASSTTAKATSSSSPDKLEDTLLAGSARSGIIEMMGASTSSVIGPSSTADSALQTPPRQRASHFNLASPPSAGARNQQQKQQQQSSEFPIKMLGSVLIVKDSSISRLELFRSHLCTVSLIGSSAVVVIDMDRIAATARQGQEYAASGRIGVAGGGGSSPTASFDFVRTSLVIGDVSLFTDDERAVLRSSYGLPQGNSMSNQAGGGGGGGAEGVAGENFAASTTSEDTKLLDQLAAADSSAAAGGGGDSQQQQQQRRNSPPQNLGPMASMFAGGSSNVDPSRRMSMKSQEQYKGLLKQELQQQERKDIVSDTIGSTVGAGATAAALAGDHSGAVGSGDFVFPGQQKHDDTSIVPSSGVVRRSDFTVAMAEQQQQRDENKKEGKSRSTTFLLPSEQASAGGSEKKKRTAGTASGSTGSMSGGKQHMPSPTWDLEFHAAIEPPAHLLQPDAERALQAQQQQQQQHAGSMHQSSGGLGESTMMFTSSISPAAAASAGFDQTGTASFSPQNSFFFGGNSSASRRQQLKVIEQQRQNIHPFYTHRSSGGEATFEDRERISAGFRSPGGHGRSSSSSTIHHHQHPVNRTPSATSGFTSPAPLGSFELVPSPQKDRLQQQQQSGKSIIESLRSPSTPPPPAAAAVSASQSPNRLQQQQQSTGVFPAGGGAGVVSRSPDFTTGVSSSLRQKQAPETETAEEKKSGEGGGGGKPRGVRLFKAAASASMGARSLSNMLSSSLSTTRGLARDGGGGAGDDDNNNNNQSKEDAIAASSFAASARWGQTDANDNTAKQHNNNGGDDDDEFGGRCYHMAPRHAVRYPHSVQPQQKMAQVPNRNMGCPPDSSLDYHGIDADEEDRIIPGTFAEKNPFKELVKDNTMERLRNRQSASGGGPFSNRLLVDPSKIKLGGRQIDRSEGGAKDGTFAAAATTSAAGKMTASVQQNPHLRRESLTDDVPNIPSEEANARNQEKILRLLMTPGDSDGVTEPAPSRLSNMGAAGGLQQQQQQKQMVEGEAFFAHLQKRPDSQQQQQRGHRTSPVQQQQQDQQQVSSFLALSGKFPITREQILGEFSSEDLDEDTVRRRLQRLYVSNRGFTPDLCGKQLASEGVVTSTGDVAEEVAARLLSAFGPAPSRPKAAPSRRKTGASQHQQQHGGGGGGGDRAEEYQTGGGIISDAEAAAVTAAQSKATAGACQFITPTAPTTARPGAGTSRGGGGGNNISSLSSSGGGRSLSARGSKRFGSRSFAKEIKTSEQFLAAAGGATATYGASTEAHLQQQRQRDVYKPVRSRHNSSKQLSSPARIVYQSPVRPRTVGDDVRLAKGAPPSYVESVQEERQHNEELERQKPVFVESRYRPKVGTAQWQAETRRLNEAVEDAQESQIKIQRAMRRRQIVAEAHGKTAEDEALSGLVFRTLKQDAIHREKPPVLPPKRVIDEGQEPVSLWRAKRVLKNNKMGGHM